MQNLFCCGGIWDLQAETLVEGDNELQGINRVQAEAAWAKERLVIADFCFRNLKHQVFYHHLLYALVKSYGLFHAIDQTMPHSLPGIE